MEGKDKQQDIGKEILGLTERITRLKQLIKECEEYKAEIKKTTEPILRDYLKNRISYREYKERVKSLLGKTEEDWIKYYNDIIEKAEDEIKTLTQSLNTIKQGVKKVTKQEETRTTTQTRRQSRITQQGTQKTTRTTKQKHIVRTLLLITVITLLITTPFLFNTIILLVQERAGTTRITGLFVYNQTGNLTNATINIINITNISNNITANITNITNITNVTNITESTNITNITTNLTINVTNITANITNITNITTNLTNFTNITNITANITNLTLNITNITTNLTINITNITVNLTTNITVNITENMSNITNLTLNITNITKPNTPPELTALIPNITVKNNETVTINLTNYFIDKDNDTLIFLGIKDDNVTIIIEDGIATITFDNITGQRQIQFIASDSKNITYSNKITITILPSIINEPPICDFSMISPITMLVNEEKTINLDDYCFDNNNDLLNYEISSIKPKVGIETRVINNTLTIKPEEQGNYTIAILVNDSKNTTQVEIRVNAELVKTTKEIVQLPATLGKPVVWVKRIGLKTKTPVNLETKLPSEAFNITIIRETVNKQELIRTLKQSIDKGAIREVLTNTELKQNILPQNKILIRKAGVTRTLESINKGVNKEIIDKNKLVINTTLEQEVKTPGVTGLFIFTPREGQAQPSITVKQAIKSMIIWIKNLIVRIVNIITKMIINILSSMRITGFIVSNLDTNTTIIIPAELLNESQNITIIYETPPPEITKQEVSLTPRKWLKQITINSELHYTNITSQINISELITTAEEHRIHIYEVRNNKRVEVTNNLTYKIKLLDTNNNDYIDTISFVIPHLSNVSYEIEIDLVILNIQSYPTVGGNWTVRFNTTGMADLKITTVNGTTYAEQSIDDNTTTNAFWARRGRSINAGVGIGETAQAA